MGEGCGVEVARGVGSKIDCRNKIGQTGYKIEDWGESRGEERSQGESPYWKKPLTKMRKGRGKAGH